MSTTPDPTAPPVPMSPAVVLGLTQQVDELVEKLDVMEERRRLDRRLWLVGISVVATLCAFIVATVITTAILASGNRENVRIIKDCTQVGGTCFQDGQKRTQDVVQLLIEQNLAVHTCRLKPEVVTPAQLEACVELELRD